jgi:type II secretory pathway pseudopilin PulG
MKCVLRGRSRPSVPPEATEGGFTLVEVMVAVLILMMAAVALAAVLTQTVAAVSFGQQSQQASNLAAAAVAEAEAMPWASTPTSGDADYGLASSDVASDKNLTGDGSGGYCFEGMHVVVQGVAGTGTCASSWKWTNVTSTQACQNSLLVLPSVTSGAAPLDPHITCVVMNGTEFTLSVYPTQVVSSGTGVSVSLETQVTAVVTWDGSATSSDGSYTRVSDTAIVCGAPTGSQTAAC